MSTRLILALSPRYDLIRTLREVGTKPPGTAPGNYASNEPVFCPEDRTARLGGLPDSITVRHRVAFLFHVDLLLRLPESQDCRSPNPTAAEIDLLIFLSADAGSDPTSAV
jgi:hypothetical protein